jgi:hypothetical protein
VLRRNQILLPVAAGMGTRSNTVTRGAAISLQTSLSHPRVLNLWWLI